MGEDRQVISKSLDFVFAGKMKFYFGTEGPGFLQWKKKGGEVDGGRNGLLFFLVSDYLIECRSVVSESPLE